MGEQTNRGSGEGEDWSPAQMLAGKSVATKLHFDLPPVSADSLHSELGGRLTLLEFSTLGYVNRAAVSPVFKLSPSRLLCPCLYSGLLRTQASGSSAAHIHPHLARWDSLRRSDRLESPLTFSYFCWFLLGSQSRKYIWHLDSFIWLLLKRNWKENLQFCLLLHSVKWSCFTMACVSSQPIAEQESIFLPLSAALFSKNYALNHTVVDIQWLTQISHINSSQEVVLSTETTW